MKLEDKVSNPEEEAHLHLPCYRTEGKWVYLRCSGCGKKVSTYLIPEGEFILRADITCPECLMKQPTYSDAIKACQSQVDEWEKEIKRIILQAIADEEEYPSKMPDELWAKLNGDRELTETTLRNTVRLTKNGITDRFLVALKERYEH